MSTSHLPDGVLSAHVYVHESLYGSNFDHLLVECVRPFVASCTQRGWISSFFFVRHIESGPHVRLRFRGEPDRLDSSVRPELVIRLRHYFERFPTQVRLTAHEIETVRQYFWGWDSFRLTDTVEFVPYVPEQSRFGGRQGMGIAEEHFAQSSDTCLRLLADRAYRPLTSSVRLGLGFQLLILLTEALRTAGADPTAMLGYYWRQCLSVEPGCEAQAFAGSCERGYRAQVESVGDLTHRLRAGTTLPRVLTAWRSHLASSVARLQAMTDLDSTASANLTSSSQRLINILTSYAHLTANRLGIAVEEEAYLAYVLRRVLTGPV